MTEPAAEFSRDPARAYETVERVWRTLLGPDLQLNAESKRDAKLLEKHAAHNPGTWRGQRLSALGLADGAEVTPDAVRAVFGRLEHPRTAAPLGRRPRVYLGGRRHTVLFHHLRVSAPVSAGFAPDLLLDIYREAHAETVRQLQEERPELVMATWELQAGSPGERPIGHTAVLARAVADDGTFMPVSASSLRSARRIFEQCCAEPIASSVRTVDVPAALALIPSARARLDEMERDLIAAARDRGESWDSLGQQLGRSANALQQRYRRVGGDRTWPTRRPAGLTEGRVPAEYAAPALAAAVAEELIQETGWQDPRFLPAACRVLALYLQAGALEETDVATVLDWVECRTDAAAVERILRSHAAQLPEQWETDLVSATAGTSAESRASAAQVRHMIRQALLP